MARSAAAVFSMSKGRASVKRAGFPRVIAIDGPSAAGKSTVGILVGRRLGYLFLDTGAMYRAITLAALRRGIDLGDEGVLGELAGSAEIEMGPPRLESVETCTVSVDGDDVTTDLRRPEVEAAVSLVSRVPAVRQALVATQRRLAGHQSVVMAGRDIGTVVLPDADLKLYLDASLEERARRRHRELQALGQTVTEDQVLHDLRRRDSIDSQRSTSPLRPAEDAIIIDTDGMTLEQVVENILTLAETMS
ncbi:MAG: (d)CMP kinase [Dehalococcoidia bacterium]